MAYERLAISPTELYHLTKREALDSILRDGRIKPADGLECWFCLSVPDMLRYMEYTVMQEGKSYVAADFTMKRYPQFVPEDYVILKLTPRFQNGQWVRWNQEFPPGAPPGLLERGAEFSRLKVGFRGALKFYANPEVIEVAQLLTGPQMAEAPKTAGPNLTM